MSGPIVVLTLENLIGLVLVATLATAWLALKAYTALRRSMGRNKDRADR